MGRTTWGEHSKSERFTFWLPFHQGFSQSFRAAAPSFAENNRRSNCKQKRVISLKKKKEFFIFRSYTSFNINKIKRYLSLQFCITSRKYPYTENVSNCAHFSVPLENKRSKKNGKKKKKKKKKK